IAVSCAGVGWAGRVVARDGTPHDLDLFSTVISINLIGTFNVLRLAAAAMAGTEPTETSERGVIVNTASIAAFDGQIGQIAYATSKAGVVGLTLPAARDLASVGVRVVTIAPCTFDPPILAIPPVTQRQAPADAHHITVEAASDLRGVGPHLHQQQLRGPRRGVGHERQPADPHLVAQQRLERADGDGTGGGVDVEHVTALAGGHAEAP